MAEPTEKGIKKALVWALPKLPPALIGGPKFEHLYPDILRDMERKLKLECRIEWDSFGQGYASFVDAFVYQDKPEFRLKFVDKDSHHFAGAHILLCRLAPYYVLGQGSKAWKARGGGGGSLLSFSGVDVFPIQAVEQLTEKVTNFLSTQQLVRLRKADVAEQLPAELQFDSNLIDEKHRLFDALFFWND